MLKLDIAQALHFLDMLDPAGRHTLASEAPFGSRGSGPRWEQGATYEPELREYLIEDIEARQARRSNVYYGVNRPCIAADQEGWNGKCNVNDIIAVRALAFDIDFRTARTPESVNALLGFVDDKLTGPMRPSLVIDSGGGFQLIYLLREIIDVRSNPDERRATTHLANDFEALLSSLAPLSLPIKIDNMSNLDRVMRLPGTVNFPKAEKIAKGQVEALAHIAVDYRVKCDLRSLREHVPEVHVAPPTQLKKPYVQRPNDPWTPYAKAKFCCEYIRDCGIADTNSWYSWNVMFPLIGEATNGTITWEEAEDLFLEAVSGGERYGGPGRGLEYFRRQWRSHLHSSRNGQKTLGSLIHACKEHGMPTPWKDAVVWERSFEEQLVSIKNERHIVDSETAEMLRTLWK
jgi:hypothetical protein